MLNGFAFVVRLIGAAVLMGICVCSWAVPTLQDYGSLPEIQLITLSPSGDIVAYRRVTADYDRIVVFSRSKKKTIASFDVSSKKPEGMYFVNDDQLVLVASEVRKIMGFRDKIDLSTAFLVDLKNNNSTRQLLIPGEVIYRGQSGLGRILGLSADGNFAYMPAFVGEDDRDTPDYALLKVNLKAKRAPTVFSRGTYNTRDFFVDGKDNVLAQESYEEHNNVHRVRARKGTDWVDIFKETVEIQEKSFVGLTPDYQSLVMLSTDADSGRSAYYTMALADGKITGPIFSRKDADIEAVITNYQRVVLGVRYGGLTPSYQFFDAALNERVKTILAEFPDQAVQFIDYSADWKQLLIYVEGPSASGDYYVVEDGKPLEYLASARAQIPAEQVNPIGKVTFTARDGLKIPTLLTIPKEKVTAMKNLPTIVMPHGGPASQDRVGFDWMAQALASQGYLVIQPQFRGSKGFGLDHEVAGYGEWGKKMQDDVTDAVNFAVKKGMTDPSKICIVGASYGGYSALAGGAFTPDLYRCVVSIAGIGDLKALLTQDRIEHGKDSWVLTYMQRQFTNGENDTSAMAAVSPEFHADKFKAPVLLIHGIDDKRVPFNQSEEMNKALKKAGKQVKLVELKGEDHYLSKGPTRMTALQETIDFVNANLK